MTFDQANPALGDTPASAVPHEDRLRFGAQRSRRSLLVAAIGGVGAAVAAAVGRPSIAAAADGKRLVIGHRNIASTLTTLVNPSNSHPVLNVRASKLGTAIKAQNQDGVAIEAISAGGQGISGYGYYSGISGAANDGTGVSGSGGRNGVAGDGGEVGVVGRGAGAREHDSYEAGVVGIGPVGVVALAGPSETAATGIALMTVGRISLGTSGQAAIPAGATSVTVTPDVDVAPDSFVLLTPGANIGNRTLWFTTNPTTDRFAIHMSSSRTTATNVSWLLLG
jgi:hypothetical protein